MKPTIYTAKELTEPLALSFETVATALQHGAIDAEHGIMRFGSNYTFLVTIRHDDTEFLAIYKPRMGESPLWDFPEGTLCQREYAAFVLSDALNWHIVPPTVLREDAPRGIGSVQAFINHDPNQHYFRFGIDKLPDVKRVMAFDIIANNADRKGGHVLLDDMGRVWGIDHGLCFNHANKLRTVMWEFGREGDIPIAGEDVPEDVLSDIEMLCQQLEDKTSAVWCQMSALLATSEMLALKRRIDRLLQTRTFPNPGMGASRPWPSI
jgi:hypothetical protein